MDSTSPSDSDEESDFDFSKVDSIRVIGRFRPVNDVEKRNEKIHDYKDSAVKLRTSRDAVMSRPLGKGGSAFKAALDHFFATSASQKAVFNKVGRPLVRSVLLGYNATVFAYGQTGSGKTYTMFGPLTSSDQSSIGLVARCITMLIKQLNKRTHEVSEWQLTTGMVQLYKRSLLDLLEPKKKSLLIKHNFQTGTPYVQNLKTLTITSVTDFLVALAKANKNRVVASHKLSAVSSRSHMLLLLTLEQQMRDGSVKTSKLNFGDLAGSEDITKALGDRPDPERLKEAIAINSDLTALTTLISALSKKMPVSYRSSELTHILQDSLGGNSKTTMLVNLSPHLMNRAETMRTLRFAHTAKSVKTKARVNTHLTRAQMNSRIAELQALVATLKKRVLELETQLAENGLAVEMTDFDALELEMMPTTLHMGDGSKKRLKKKKKKKPAAVGTVVESDSKIEAAAIGGAKRKVTLAMDLDSVTSASVSSKSVHLSTDVFSLATRSTGISVSMSPLMRELQKALDANKSQAQVLEVSQRANVQLENECEALQKQMEELRRQMEESSEKWRESQKEKELSAVRSAAMAEEITGLREKDESESKKWEQRLQKQLQRVQRGMDQKNEAVKMQTQLNLVIEQLRAENGAMDKQMTALREALHSATAAAPPSAALLRDLERILRGVAATSAEAASVSQKSATLLTAPKKRKSDSETKRMTDADAHSDFSETSGLSAAELLMSRFAPELCDARLSAEENARKTAKLMQDLSEDIGALMGRWLHTSASARRAAAGGGLRSKALVFSVRQLIGHFNVCFNQLKEAKHSFGSDLKLEVTRRDKEISALRKENAGVLRLRDDLQEKDEQLTRVKAQLAEVRYEGEQMQSQSEEMSSLYEKVSSQVSYLERELDKSRTQSTRSLAELTQLRRAKSKTAAGSCVPLAALLAAEDSDDAKAAATSSSGLTDVPPPSARRQSTAWRSQLRRGDGCDVCDESGIWWTARIVQETEEKVQLQFEQCGDCEWLSKASGRLAPLRSRYRLPSAGSRVLKEGFMSKEGKLFRTWRRRYFVLFDSGAVHYYANKGEAEPISAFSVLAMTGTRQTAFGRAKTPGFELQTKDRLWKLACDSKEEAREWLQLIHLLNDGVYEAPAK